MSQLQRYQNEAARIVSLRRKYDHIAPVLKELHWLPVEQRINYMYKILLLAYVAQQGMDPPYLSSLLSPYKPGRPLLSQGKHLLTTPHYPITISITTTTTRHCHYLRIIIINGCFKGWFPSQRTFAFLLNWTNFWTFNGLIADDLRSHDAQVASL